MLVVERLNEWEFFETSCNISNVGDLAKYYTDNIKCSNCDQEDRDHSNCKEKGTNYKFHNELFSIQN